MILMQTNRSTDQKCLFCLNFNINPHFLATRRCRFHHVGITPALGPSPPLNAHGHFSIRSCRLDPARCCADRRLGVGRLPVGGDAEHKGGDAGHESGDQGRNPSQRSQAEQAD